MQSNANEIIWWLGASNSSSTASSIVLKSLSAASVQLQSKGILEAVDELFEALNHQVFSIALLYTHLFTKFDAVNPCRIKIIYESFKGLTEAVDELLKTYKLKVLIIR